LIHKTFRDFGKISARERNLIFVDKDKSSSDIDAQNPNLDWQNWESKGINEYEKYLEKAVKQGIIDDIDRANRLNNAQKKIDKKATTGEEVKENVQHEKKTVELIEKSRNEGGVDSIADKAKNQIEKEYVGSLEELRKYIRNEIMDLGIKPEVKPDNIVKKEIERYSREIEKRVKSLINAREHRRIFDEIHEEEKLAKECFEKMKSLFDAENTDKRDFLNALRLKEIPQGAGDDEKQMAFRIEEIMSFKNNLDSEDKTLVGITGKKLFLLNHALGNVETLFSKWKNEKVESMDKLRWRLDEYEKNLRKIKFEAEDNAKNSPKIKQLVDNWDNFESFKNNDIKHLRKTLAKKNPTDGDLKLVSAFLESNEEELGEMKQAFEDIRTKKEEATTEIEKDVVEIPASKKADEHEALGEHEATNIFHRFGKKFVNTMTANGKITWYSFEDIAKSFGLIKEAWTKHWESSSEDKRAPLAENVMFWKKEVVRRIKHTDLSAERGRADELKKTYKNFTDKELLAELSELPAKDRSRAILESLADRGNLRMSNKKLIDIVCGKGKFSEEEWRLADEKIDHTPMREAFKDAIDGHGHGTGFIGEIGYGRELLEMHNAGFSKAEGSGKSYASSNEAGSTRAETKMFANELNRVGLEGEGTISGMLEEMVDRANTFSDNGELAEAIVRVNGIKETFTRSADIGLIGLLITDGFFRGNLSRELMMKIGKSNEQAFRPFATFQEVVGARKKDDPVTGHKISHFEYWGWVDEDKKTITKLGATQIINFFNGRNSIAKIKKSDGSLSEKTIHMATDSNFKVHSGTRVTSIEQVRNKVGDKLAGSVMKASTIDVYDQATKRRRDTGSATGELREITSMIKAGVEDFIDGKSMMNEGKERYFDSFSGKEVDAEGKFLKDDGTIDREKTPIPSHQKEGMGEMRMERGKEILVRILKNMWLYREDRKILEEQPLYKIYKRETTEEGAAHEDSKAHAGTLREFLDSALGQWGHTAEVREIMAGYNRLQDRNQRLTSTEIEEVQRSGKTIERKEDLFALNKNNRGRASGNREVYP